MFNIPYVFRLIQLLDILPSMAFVYNTRF